MGAAAALLAAVFCWGVAVPLSKRLLSATDPGVLICVQMGASVLVLGAVALLTRARLALPRSQLLPFLLIGTLEPGLAYYLEFIGLKHTTALHTALILALEPVGILALNITLFHVRRDLPLLLCAAVASFGVLIAVLGKSGQGGEGSVYGDTIVLLGTMAASLYVCLSTQLVSSQSVIALLFVQQLASLVFVLGVAGVWALLGHVPPLPHGPALLGAAAVGILQFALAFLFYFQGVRQSPGYWSVVVLNLAPIVGIVASVALLGETLSRLYLLGGVLCLAASLATRLREHALEAS